MISPARKVLGITVGDPAGIGPEIVRACLADAQLPAEADYRVIGAADGFTPGRPDVASAKASWDALEAAARLLESGEIHGMVTGPVSKAGLQAAGFPFPGQTEFFAARDGTDNFAMCLTGNSLTVGLVTIHVPLCDVPRLLRREEIVRTGKLLAEFVQRRIGRAPRIAVAGLNPHAGEGGIFGVEETEIIAPAVAELSRIGSFSGPHAPDTVFHRALQGEFDAVLCMYHDQGLIPLKLVAFDSGVNVTLGLSYPRTSPDHGTAFDIAGTGRANPSSMLAAIRLAEEMLRKMPR